MPFDALRSQEDPGIPPLHPDRLACGGTIVAPCALHEDRLLAWFWRFMFALLTMGVLAVIYGYVAITP